MYFGSAPFSWQLEQGWRFGRVSKLRNANVQTPKHYCILGTGKLARHLAEKLLQEGLQPLYLWGRNTEKAAQMAAELGANLCISPKHFPASTTAILAVSDHSIAEVAQLFKGKSEMMMHLSGTQSLSLLQDCAAHTAVLWPNQSFTPGNTIVWKNVPMSLEASDEFAHQAVLQLANMLEGPIAWLSGAQRKQLHLAAVAANNFVNHLMVLAEEWCIANQLDFQFLMPMVEQSVKRLREVSPSKTQTGPASRNDQVVIAQHLALLKDFPEFSEVYALLSKQISERLSANDHRAPSSH